MTEIKETLDDIEKIKEAVDRFNRLELPRFVKEVTDETFGKRMIRVNFVYKQLTRYRWHDLRKDPTDLPKENSAVLVAVDLLGKRSWTVCTYNGLFVDGVNIPTQLTKLVVKWKYIDDEVEE